MINYCINIEASTKWKEIVCRIWWLCGITSDIHAYLPCTPRHKNDHCKKNHALSEFKPKWAFLKLIRVVVEVYAISVWLSVLLQPWLWRTHRWASVSFHSFCKRRKRETQRFLIFLSHTHSFCLALRLRWEDMTYYCKKKTRQEIKVIIISYIQICCNKNTLVVWK